jgi:hypothetical protein
MEESFMGEWSRRVGEVGEEIVGEFFELIGWGDAQRSLTVQCMKPDRHGSSSRPNTTHGIDYLFSCESKLLSRTLDHLVVSVKYTSGPYPSNPNTKFKEHFLDLSKTIECFRRSVIRQSSSSQFSGVDNGRDIGVLFWLSNDTTNSDDILHTISSARGVDEYNYGTIYVVDNKRVSFIYDTLKYLSLNRRDSVVEFLYPNTGGNYNPISKETAGKVLPVEFLNAGILPLKLTNPDGSKTAIISLIDGFSRDHLKRLMGLACEITSDFAKETLILFPDFDRLIHENQVSEAKSSFRNKKFTETVNVLSYQSNFRNV